MWATISDYASKVTILARLLDKGYRYVIHPDETAGGLTAANLTFGFKVGDIRRYGGDPTGVAACDTALTNALAANLEVTFPKGTFKFTGAAGFTVNGKRIRGAGSHATMLQFPNLTGFAFTVQGLEANAPGLEGFSMTGNALAAGGITTNPAAGGIGVRRGVFKDLQGTGFTKAGTYVFDIVGYQGAGVYNCSFDELSTGTVANSNAGGMRFHTSDAPAQPNRANGNKVKRCTLQFCSSDGLYLDYASGNSFEGYDCEANGGYGINIQNNCFGTFFGGGYVESNTSGGFNKLLNGASTVTIAAGNINDAFHGDWNHNDHVLCGGTAQVNLGIDASGNIYPFGNVNFAAPNPNIQYNGVNYSGLDTTHGLSVDYLTRRSSGVAKASAAGALDLSAVATEYVEVSLTENITAITFPQAVDGNKCRIIFKQGAGPYTVAGWPGAVHLAGGAFAVTATNGKYDMIEFEFHSDFGIWIETRRSQNM